MHKLLIGVASASTLIVAPVDSSIALTGSYSQSWFYCQVVGGYILECKCRTRSGGNMNSIIDFSRCPNQSVANKNGQLICGP